MTLSYRVAKAGVVREDGKVFSDKTLKMFAKEAPEKYTYLKGPQELWLNAPEENEENAHIS